MKINLGIIGCGNQFRKVYFRVVEELLNQKKIKSLIIYSRDLNKIYDIKDKLKCNITDNLNEILDNSNINFLILSVPLALRNEILLKKKFDNKIILTEPPIGNNLSNFFEIKRKIKKKKSIYEIFEDRYYFNYNLENLRDIKIIVNKNNQWMHHSIAQLFKVNSKVGNIKKIHFNVKNKKYDIYKIYFSNFSFLYKFLKKKENVDRKKGYIKILNNKNEIIRLKNLSTNDYSIKESAFNNCVQDLIKEEIKTEKLYSHNFLEFETLILSLMKVMKKFKIQKLNSLSIKFIKLFFYLLSYLKFT